MADIDKAIRRIIGNNEEAFQDAWLSVLENKATTDEDIRLCCLETLKSQKTQSFQRHFKLVSMDTPLKSPNGDFTLHDVLQGTITLETAIEKQPYRRWGKPSVKGTIHLDGDITDILQKKYPSLTYAQALRHVLGLPQIHSKTRKWQPWEDEILKKLYPIGGTFACSTELNHRSVVGIRQRASRLGIKFEVFKPSSQMYTQEEVCRILHMNHGQVAELVANGYLRRTNPFRNFQVYHYDDLAEFVRKHPFRYRHTYLRDGFRQFVPAWVWDWKQPKEIASEIPASADTIRRQVRLGRCPYRTYRQRIWYVRVDDVKKVLTKTS